MAVKFYTIVSSKLYEELEKISNSLDRSLQGDESFELKFSKPQMAIIDGNRVDYRFLALSGNPKDAAGKDFDVVDPIFDSESDLKKHKFYEVTFKTVNYNVLYIEEILDVPEELESYIKKCVLNEILPDRLM